MVLSDVALYELDDDQRVDLMNQLGYSIDSKGFLIDEQKNFLLCKYSKEPVHIDKAGVLPGSILIINVTPLTMAQYYMEYGS